MKRKFIYERISLIATMFAVFVVGTVVMKLIIKFFFGY